MELPAEIILARSPYFAIFYLLKGDYMVARALPMRILDLGGQSSSSAKAEGKQSAGD